MSVTLLCLTSVLQCHPSIEVGKLHCNIDTESLPVLPNPFLLSTTLFDDNQNINHVFCVDISSSQASKQDNFLFDTALYLTPHCIWHQTVFDHLQYEVEYT